MEESGNSNFNPWLSFIQIKRAKRFSERKKCECCTARANILQWVLLGGTLSSPSICPFPNILGLILDKETVFEMAALSVQKAAVNCRQPPVRVQLWGKAQLQQQVLLRLSQSWSGEKESQTKTLSTMLKQAWVLWSPFFTFHWGIYFQTWELEVCFCQSSIEKLTHI